MQTGSDPNRPLRALAFGGHVVSWCPDALGEALYVSPDAITDGTKPIRGGIPICFPWFGPHPTDKEAPSHGLVRGTDWQIDHQDDAFTASIDPAGWSLRWTGDAAEDGVLQLRAWIRNASNRVNAFAFAAHTYFRVDDIERVTLTGLETSPFLDQLTARHHAPEGRSITFASETDRVYFRPDETDGLGLRVSDQRTIRIETEAAPSAVVWNPWIEKGRSLADLPDAGYRDFVCVESGCIGEQAIRLAPGETHELGIRYTAISTA